MNSFALLLRQFRVRLRCARSRWLLEFLVLPQLSASLFSLPKLGIFEKSSATELRLKNIARYSAHSRYCVGAAALLVVVVGAVFGLDAERASKRNRASGDGRTGADAWKETFADYAWKSGLEVEVETRLIETTNTALLRVKGSSAVADLARAIARGDVHQKVVDRRTAAALEKALRQLTGTSVRNLPHVNGKSGERATVGFTREFRHPKSWSRNAEAGLWMPMNFTSRDTGVTLQVTPWIERPNSVQLKCSAQAVEFVGWRDFETKKRKASHDGGKHRIEPVFSTRKTEVTTNLAAGETLLLSQFKETELNEPFRTAQGSNRLIVLLTARIIKNRE